MEALYAETGLPVVAHNRFWATDTVYSTHNGGQVAQIFLTLTTYFCIVHVFAVQLHHRDRHQPVAAPGG